MPDFTQLPKLTHMDGTTITRSNGDGTIGIEAEDGSGNRVAINLTPDHAGSLKNDIDVSLANSQIP